MYALQRVYDLTGHRATEEQTFERIPTQDKVIRHAAASTALTAHS
jgi:hypothetical protein